MILPPFRLWREQSFFLRIEIEYMYCAQRNFLWNFSHWLRPKTFGLTCKILNSKSRDFSQADRFFIRASSLVFWSNSVLFFLKKKISTQFTEKKRLYDKSGAKSNRPELQCSRPQKGGNQTLFKKWMRTEIRRLD